MAGATAMTFASLIQSLKNYTEAGSASNTLLAQELPQLINRAERSLADRLKIQGYRDVLQGVLLPQNPSLLKPAGWRNTVTFTIGTNATPFQTQFQTARILRARSYEYMRMVEPDITNYGTPSMYTDYDLNNWFFAPTPDFEYPFEVIVYRLPDLLSDINQTNYLTQYVPNLLLFQCLANLEPFLKDDARIVTWKALLENEFKAIDAQEIAKVVDRTQSRTSV